MNIQANKILIVGDTHGDWGALNQLINKKYPEVIFVTGDFGYWIMTQWVKLENNEVIGDDEFRFEIITDLNRIKNKDTKIFWVPGNHEHWWALQKKYCRRGPEPIEVEKNIFYCPIGSTSVLNGKNILFVGGAESIDKNARTLGVDWFPEEILTQPDFYYIEENVKQDIDMVISHTCPVSFNVDKISTASLGLKALDPSKVMLEWVLNKYQPKEWFFGHYHGFLKGVTKNCNWTCLDYPKHCAGHWWIEYKN